MKANPLLAALGLSPQDRAVLIHTDDIGMCHASLAAYADLTEHGVISAGSVMVPCPWFPATARYCVDHAGIVDMGVHTTLNSEWRSGYRWGPISTCDPASGLIDEAGYLRAATKETQTNALPEAVHREITAQVERALAAGIDVTHIDTHMGTVLHLGFVESYVRIPLEHGIPPFVVRPTAEVLQARGLDQALVGSINVVVEALAAQGVPVFDDIRSPSFTSREAHLDQVKNELTSLKPGLTYLIIHPSKDTPELRAILPNRWQARVADYETFMKEELRAFIDAQGIRIIGWRQLRDLMRSHH
jgi:chitin disaccharide deacetylase